MEREVKESGWQKIDWSQCGVWGFEVRRFGKDFDMVWWSFWIQVLDNYIGGIMEWWM